MRRSAGAADDYWVGGLCRAGRRRALEAPAGSRGAAAAARSRGFNPVAPCEQRQTLADRGALPGVGSPPKLETAGVIQRRYTPGSVHG